MQIMTGPTLLFVPLLRCVMSRKKYTTKQNKVQQKYLKSDLIKKTADGTIQCQEILDTREFKPKQKNRNNENIHKCIISMCSTTDKANSYDLLTFLTNKLLTCISVFCFARANPTMTTDRPSQRTNQNLVRCELRAGRARNLFYSIDYIVRNGIDGAHGVVGFVRYTFVMICVFCISQRAQCIRISFRCFLICVVHHTRIKYAHQNIYLQSWSQINSFHKIKYVTDWKYWIYSKEEDSPERAIGRARFFFFLFVLNHIQCLDAALHILWIHRPQITKATMYQHKVQKDSTSGEHNWRIREMR